ncbi:MAG: GIY-YIG nuclease family protein [Calothrix sp. FI2-JRJ7]|jgi:hypothetical protein|nr:GIY-YIG nuclease family protein [Calothrix sp. FI2-JRJ7]
MLEYNFSTSTINDIPSGRSGYVYLLKAEGTPRYKIGRSNNPLVRSQKITTQSPYPLIVKDCFWTPDCVTDEKCLHKLFSHCRVHGEYFEFDENIEDSENSPLKKKPLSHLGRKATPPYILKGSYTLTYMARSAKNFLTQVHQIYSENDKSFDLNVSLLLIFANAKSLSEIKKIHKFVYEQIPQRIAFTYEQYGYIVNPENYINGLIDGYLDKLFLDGEVEE